MGRPLESDSRDLSLGCGNEFSSRTEITLDIQTTTGGSFTLTVNNNNTIENLKKLVSKKLKVSKDRICLLHRERQLRDGTLHDNGLMDGSRVILLPSVETGLLAQRPENNVMQALESLNDTQVNDFLSGKSPLNLTMRLGDHMMLIQLQLSTLNPIPTTSGSTTNCSRITARRNSTPPTFKSKPYSIKRQNSAELTNAPSTSVKRSASATGSSQDTPKTSVPPLITSPVLRKQDIETLQNAFQLVKTLSDMHSTQDLDETDEQMSTEFTESFVAGSCDDSIYEETVYSTDLDQSPIKSLSNLVSSPIKTIPLKTIPIPNFTPMTSNFPKITTAESVTHLSETSEHSDPIAANLTSCICSSLHTVDSQSPCNCQSNKNRPEPIPGPSTRYDMPSLESRNKQLSSLLHKSINKAIVNSKSKTPAKAISILSKTQCSPTLVCKTDRLLSTDTTTESLSETTRPTSSPILDTRALAEASRNLTKTLKKLSNEVLTNKVDMTEENQRKIGQGAVIESMKHHGKGIYSGTFSGTLNPALQDRYGRPKRDISTIIHILNDLLCATPQYHRGARISFEPTNSGAPRTISRQVSQRTSHQTQDCSCSTCNSKASSSCTYGECMGHYSTIPCPSQKSVKPCATQSSSDECKPYVCTCEFDCDDALNISEDIAGNSESLTCNNTRCVNNRGEENIEPVTCKECGRPKICSKCMSLPPYNLALENNKTKCKLDHLRLVMQQKKQRRQARKRKVAPYSASGLISAPEPSNSLNVSDNPSLLVEEVDTLA